MRLRVCLRLGCLAMLATLFASCADCETISDCEDACEDAYPDDEVRRVGCYQQCELKDYDCSAASQAPRQSASNRGLERRAIRTASILP